MGYSIDVANRLSSLAVAPRDVLAVIEAERAQEQELHQRFARHLAKGDTWYRPVPELIAYVNTIRDQLDLGPIEP